jgi:predicted metal-binding membrane protein
MPAIALPSQPLVRQRLALLGVLLVLAVVAWVISGQRMGGMDAMPGADLGSLGFFLTVWVVMMAAMMFPSVAPAVLLYDRLRAGHRERGNGAPADATGLFVAGYLVTWTAAGLGAYGLLQALAHIPPFEGITWDGAGHWVAGAVIVGAAAYQLTPLKDVCLTKCRSPLMFLAERWRHGRLGGLWLGIAHGAWCVGCCWALMAALFAVGVMSLGWMAFVAVLIGLEKLWPVKRVANLSVATLLLVLGLAVAFVPDAVPGLDMSTQSMDPGMRMMG